MRPAAALALLILIVLLPPRLVSQIEFSQANAEKVLRHLVLDIGPRPMGSPAERRALELAVSEFRDAGCDTAYIMPFDRTGNANTSSGIAVGVKRGAKGRSILIGGHIDSAGPEIPGADDDGSGAAIVMELARILGGRTANSTLVFCCFGGEEEGLEGSKHFAASYPGIDSVDLMLQADMANGTGVIDMDPDTHGESAPPWLVRATVEEFDRLGYRNLRYPTHAFSLNYLFPAGAGSDHESFLHVGIPAIDLTTDPGKPIHTPRDNFENFDPSGLKRTGDVFAALARRFDQGVPSRSTENYWLYLIYRIPLFVPLWTVRCFAVLSLLTAAVALISIRARRLPAESPLFVAWPGVKLLFVAFIVAGSGWLSSDIISLVRGIRHPWLTSIPLYYTFGALAAFCAATVSIRILRWLGLTHCPYALFKRSAIILAVILIPITLYAVKLSVEIAAALLLISLAALARTAGVKILFTLLSPLWMFRIVFSEWDALLYHSIASAPPAAPGVWLLINGGVIFILTLFLLPILLAAASVVRDSPALTRVVAAFSSMRTLAVSIVLFLALGAYLLAVPEFDRYWYHDVTVKERYDMTKRSRSLIVTSSEYFRGVRLVREGGDTTIDARTALAELRPGPGFDTTWLAVERLQNRHEIGGMAVYEIELRLRSKSRPFRVSVSYRVEGGELRAFDTPLQSRILGNARTIEWYSFPDSFLVIPVSFSAPVGSKVSEVAEVTFNSLAEPVEVSGEMVYAIPRTTYVSSFLYGQ